MPRYNILIVSDEEDLCESLHVNCSNEGFTVEVAHSTKSALNKNLQSQHLLLLDLSIGHISGLKMANQIRNHPSTNTIPIIFLSSKTELNNCIDDFYLQSNDHIIKSFSTRKIVDHIKNTVHEQFLSPLN